MVHFANALALLAWMVIPAGIAYWLLVHPFLPLWRRLGARRSWAILLPIVCAVAALPWFGRALVIGDGPRFHALAFSLGVVVYALNFWLWRVGRQSLDGRTMVGLPEIEPTDTPGPLLRDGLYAHIRHPRYVSAWLFLLAIALLLGHASLWLLFAIGLVGFAVVARLEDAELDRRYGAEFTAYRQRVPAFIPRFDRLRFRDAEVKNP